MPPPVSRAMPVPIQADECIDASCTLSKDDLYLKAKIQPIGLEPPLLAIPLANSNFPETKPHLLAVLGAENHVQSNVERMLERGEISSGMRPSSLPTTTLQAQPANTAGRKRRVWWKNPSIIALIAIGLAAVVVMILVVALN